MVEGDSSALSLQEAITMQLDEMELLEMAYPEVTFSTPDARAMLTSVLAEWLDGRDGGTSGRDEDENQESCLEIALGNTPLISFRFPLGRDQGHLRVRLPRRYPEIPLLPTIEGTPRLSAAARQAVTEAALRESSRLSGAPRREPHCLQVLGEAVRASADCAERESTEPQAASVMLPSTHDSLAADGCSVGSSGRSARCGDRSSEGAPTRRAGASRSAGSTAGPRHTSQQRRRSAATSCSEGVRGGSRAGACWVENSETCWEEGGATGLGGASPPSGEDAVGKGQVKVDILLGRRLIYSHHIIAQQKRTGIVKAARELQLGGFCKVGWPGVIVVEGEDSSCEDFVKTLRGWRWKHLAVRGEDTAAVPAGRTLDEERKLPRPLEELGEKEGVSALAEKCREAGLGELFDTLLR